MTDDRDEVGSLSEEAAKLLTALQDRAGGASGENAEEAVGAADGWADTMRAIHEHVATDGAECRYCPLCRVVAVARSTSPEFREHITSAAASLVKAFSAAMATDLPRAAERWAEAADPTTQQGNDTADAAADDWAPADAADAGDADVAGDPDSAGGAGSADEPPR